MTDQQDYPDLSDADEVVYATDPEAGRAESEERDWPDHTDPEWLHYQYHIMKRSRKEMAEIANVTESAIQWQMDKKGIQARSRKEALQIKYTPDKLLDGEWLRERYVGEGLSSNQIAELLDCAGSTVDKYLDEHDIDKRSISEARRIGGKLDDASWLFTEHHIKGRTREEIANELDCSPHTITNSMKRLNIPPKDQCSVIMEWVFDDMKIPRFSGEEKPLVSEGSLDFSHRDLGQRRYRGEWVPYQNEDWLREMVERGLADKEIADLCECVPDTIRRWRERYGIKKGIKGECHYGSKLTEEDIAKIRQRYMDSDISYSELAERYSVSQSNICMVVNGEAWADAPGPIKGEDY